MIKDEPYDPVRMRQGMWDAFRLKDPRFIFDFRCAWCATGTAKDRFHPHHALVKSSQVRHWAVDNALENRVPLCWQCHDAHGQSAAMTVKALDYLCERLTAKRVALWWISLWRDHGLSVARGAVPLCEEIAIEREWRDYLELVCLPLCCAA